MKKPGNHGLPGALGDGKKIQRIFRVRFYLQKSFADPNRVPESTVVETDYRTAEKFAQLLTLSVEPFSLAFSYLDATLRAVSTGEAARRTPPGFLDRVLG